MARASPLPGLVLAPVPGKGFGVLANRPFQVGEILLRFCGEPAPVQSVENLDHWLQIGPGTFMGPSGGLDDAVNHACRPNCGLFEEEEGPVLRPLHPIHRGEEITFDYSTWMSAGHWRLPRCACRALGCRGRVEDFVALDPMLRATYEALGCVPEFVLDSVHTQQWDSGTATASP